MAIKYVDFINGNDANDGSSFANRKKTLSSVSTVLSAGDTCRIMKSDDPISIGDVTWTNRSGTLTLASARTKDFYNDGAWTASASVTATAGATRKEGSTASNMVIAAGFTTGKVAYYDMGSSQDFSAYQKVSLMARFSLAHADLSAIYTLTLCSDAAGATPVHTFAFPAIAVLANVWLPIIFDNGGALSSGIRSVALNCVADPGTVTVILDNIFATNDIHHGCLISKNTGSENKWWPLRSVVGTTAILESGPQALATVVPQGYKGTTGTVTTYIRNPIKLASVTATTTDLQTIAVSGSAGSPITFSGGWNATDMSTQTGETWVTGQNNAGEAIGTAGRTYINIEKINAVNVNKLISVTGNCNNLSLSNMQSANTVLEGFLLTPTASIANAYNVLTECYAIASDADGINCGNTALFQLIRCGAHMCTPNLNLLNANGAYLEECDFDNANTIGIVSSGSDGLRSKGTVSASYAKTGAGLSLTNSSGWRMEKFTADDGATVGILFAGSSQNVFYELHTTGNASASIDSNTTSNTENYAYKWVHDEAVTVLTPVDFENSRFVSINDNDTPNNHIIYTDGGLIDTTVSGSDLVWRLKPTSATRRAEYPLTQILKAIPVEANVAVTATVTMNRSNTGITGTFRIRGGQIAGVASDISASISAAANTDEDVSITFTPTERGVVELEVLAYGGTTYTLSWKNLTWTPKANFDTSSGDYAYTKQGVYIGAPLPEPFAFGSMG